MHLDAAFGQVVLQSPGRRWSRILPSLQSSVKRDSSLHYLILLWGLRFNSSLHLFKRLRLCWLSGKLKQWIFVHVKVFTETYSAVYGQSADMTLNERHQDRNRLFSRHIIPHLPISNCAKLGSRFEATAFDSKNQFRTSRFYEASRTLSYLKDFLLPFPQRVTMAMETFTDLATYVAFLQHFIIHVTINIFDKFINSYNRKKSVMWFSRHSFVKISYYFKIWHSASSTSPIIWCRLHTQL